MSSLSTHVLDTMHGSPALGVEVSLLMDGQRLFAGTTNSDGRCPDLPAVAPGRYRLEFDVAGYFRDRGVNLPEPPFLGMVGIDFGIAEADSHYHVPLLVSPFGYSTYRGS